MPGPYQRPYDAGAHYAALAALSHPGTPRQQQDDLIRRLAGLVTIDRQQAGVILRRAERARQLGLDLERNGTVPRVVIPRMESIPADKAYRYYARVGYRDPDADPNAPGAWQYLEFVYDAESNQSYLDVLSTFEQMAKELDEQHGRHYSRFQDWRDAEDAAAPKIEVHGVYRRT